MLHMPSGSTVFKIQYLVKLLKNYFRNTELYPDIEQYNPDMFLKKEKEKKHSRFHLSERINLIYVHLYIW